MPAKLLFCYAREDEAFLLQLKRQLAPLQRQGRIEIWYDRDITAGTLWEQAILQQLNAADIIIFLVSPDFLASDYCYSVEMQRAIERHQQGDVQIVPIIIRPVHWQALLGQFQALPPGDKPIIDPSWHTQDRAWFEVAEGIRLLLEKDLRANPSPLTTFPKTIQRSPSSSQRETPLHLHLEAVEQPHQFLLTFNSSQYPLTFNLNASVTFNDWLRRLHPVLMDQPDPSRELAPQELLRHIGTWLWDALLPLSAPAEARNALIQALQKDNAPLLLTLPEQLAGLPWELLCDPQRGFLAQRRPLLRFSSSFSEKTRESSPLPLRVLLLISSPPGLQEDSRVDVESERAAVEQATYEFRAAGMLHLLVEDIVTPSRVQQALVRFKPHLLHYIGHCDYDEQQGSVLLWEDEQGSPLLFSSKRLADLLRPRKLHAVVLHACQTARITARADVGSLATTLVQAGIPTVVAQQANFSYESSQRASDAWYRALTAGQSCAEALFEVRQALTLAERPDWAVPLLQGSEASLTPVLAVDAAQGVPDPLLTRQGAATDLPAPTGVFVGRHREMRALRLMLEQMPGSGPVLALITGPAGVGKSTLAALAVTRYGGKYKAAITLSCQGYQSVGLFLQRIDELLKRLGAPSFLEQTSADDKRSEEIKIEEAIATLNSVGPMLLIVDNLESVQREDRTLRDPALLYLLQKLLTNLHGGRVLITGRYAIKDLLPQGKFAAHVLRVSLDDLSLYETAQLLTRHATFAQLGETVRATLIREFGGLPYVYDLLSSDAASQSLDLLIHDVHRRITQERQQRSAEQWQAVHRQVVEFAALEVTVNRLSEPSRALLARLSVLYRPFPLLAIEQGLGADRMIWQPLLDWSLLRFDPLERTYRLHSITRHYAETLLSEPERSQTQAQLAAWYERYAIEESHDLADSLEAYRLWRASGNVQQAGKLMIAFAEVFLHLGFYPLLRDLCRMTLDDVREQDARLTAQVQHIWGTIAYLQGNYEEARQLYEEALRIEGQLNNQAGRASTLHQLGTIAQARGNYGEARQLYQESLETFERLGMQRERATSLHQLGTIAQAQGDYQEAQRLYQESLRIEEQLNNQLGQATSLSELGTIAADLGNYEEARQLYQKSLQIREQLSDQRGRAIILRRLGIIAQRQGNYEEALQLYQENLDISERLGIQSERAIILHQLGNIACFQGKYEEAQGLYQKSLQIKERLDDQSGRAITLYQLGNISYVQGNYEEARRLCEESLQIRERLGDQRGRAASLGQLGMIALVQGDYQEARRLHQESLETFEQFGMQREQATSLHQLGIIAQGQGDYQEARRLYEESLQIKERLGDQNGQASVFWQLGELAYAQGDDLSALTYFIQAHFIFELLSSPDREVVHTAITKIRSRMDESTFKELWQTLSGGRPLPARSGEEIAQQLLHIAIEFIRAPTWDEAKRFLESHPELLQPKVDELLQTLGAQQERDNARKLIEARRLLLAACREKGIEAAFAENNLIETFTTELNQICNEVVAALRAGNREQQDALALRLEQLLSDHIPLEGASDFLRMLVLWLREQDIHVIAARLQPPFDAIYAQMVAVAEQEETKNAEGKLKLTVGEITNLVASNMLQGTIEQRQQFATALREIQQHLSSEEATLGKLLNCFAAILQEEIPDVTALEAPWTDVWQALQDVLRTASNEEQEQRETKHG